MDLIDRRAAIKAIEDLHDCDNGFSDTYDKACIIGVIEEVPSAQRTGRWINYDSDTERYDDIKCSNCGKTFTVDSDRYCDIGFIVSDLHYCPNCGSKMEVEHERSN